MVERFRQSYILQILTAELQTVNVTNFQRNIQLFGFYAFPDVLVSKLIRMSGGVTLYCVMFVVHTHFKNVDAGRIIQPGGSQVGDQSTIGCTCLYTVGINRNFTATGDHGLRYCIHQRT